MKGTKKENAFLEQLRNVPKGFDPNYQGELTLTLSLSHQVWIDIACAASKHGQTLEEACEDLLMDATDGLHDRRYDYKSEIEDRREAELEKREAELEKREKRGTHLKAAKPAPRIRAAGGARLKSSLPKTSGIAG